MTQSHVPSRLAEARLYAILDTAYVSFGNWRSVCADLIAGGAAIVQVRAKHSRPEERDELVREVLPLFEESSGRAPQLIINDDVELCARYPITGLHIGQDDTPPTEARRRIGPDRVIGLSTHSFEQARAADALAGTIDYFCVGPVFATQTKPDYTPVGPELVRRVSAMKPRLPWFAIGGINRLTLREVLAAGASRVVVVSDLLCASSPREAATEHIRALRSPTPFPPQ